MSWLNQAIKMVGKMPVPQFYSDKLEDYEVHKGQDGAAFYRERGSIAMEAWDNSNPVTTFPNERYGFSVVNDGIADLTFTINGVTRKVKVGESYSALFEAFTDITINATSSYRAEVLK